MKICILSFGTRGDVQPYLALALRLQALGHQIIFATDPEFEPFVTQYGITFASLEASVRAIYAASLQPLVERGNLWNTLRCTRQALEPALARIFPAAWRACQGCDAIVYNPLTLIGHDIAARLDVPAFLAPLQPQSTTRAFPAYLVYAGPRLGPSYNLLTYYLGGHLTWYVQGAAINRFRRTVLGLPAQTARERFDARSIAGQRILYGFSRYVVPPPADWPCAAQVTGYWFLPHHHEWQPSAALTAFLKNGPPPIYIGFGSVVDKQRNRERTQLVLDALERTGLRAVMAQGWGGLAGVASSSRLFGVQGVPHDWLFPQVAAVVHHGGAGTTAAGLRAGKPSVIIPFNFDQPFWGRRVAELGVGPAPIPQASLNARRLARTLEQALGDQTLLKRAKALGHQLANEDGAAAAAAVIATI